jgi:hypothetical protein
MMPSSPFTIAGRTMALSLAVLLVLTGCGQRDIPPAVDEQRITFHFTPKDDRFGSFGTTTEETTREPTGGSGGGCWNGSCNLGNMNCGGDGRAAIIFIGVIIAVVVIVVVVDHTMRGVRHVRGTDYYLRLVKGSRQTSLLLRKGINRLNIHRELADGIVTGTTSADILAVGRRNGLSPFIAHLHGNELTGW